MAKQPVSDKKTPHKTPGKRDKAGRPPKNEPDDIESIQGKIATYFETCEAKEERPTYCGLALALGYASLQSLRENAKAGTPISLPIKKAMLCIDETYERSLHGNAPTGAIFALKNRGWTDKQEVELTGGQGGPVKFEIVDPPKHEDT